MRYFRYNCFYYLMFYVLICNTLKSETDDHAVEKEKIENQDDKKSTKKAIIIGAGVLVTAATVGIIWRHLLSESVNNKNQNNNNNRSDQTTETASEYKNYNNNFLYVNDTKDHVAENFMFNFIVNKILSQQMLHGSKNNGPFVGYFSGSAWHEIEIIKRLSQKGVKFLKNIFIDRLYEPSARKYFEDIPKQVHKLVPNTEIRLLDDLTKHKNLGNDWKGSFFFMHNSQDNCAIDETVAQSDALIFFTFTNIPGKNEHIIVLTLEDWRYLTDKKLFANQFVVTLTKQYQPQDHPKIEAILQKQLNSMRDEGYNIGKMHLPKLLETKLKNL